MPRDCSATPPDPHPSAPEPVPSRVATVGVGKLSGNTWPGRLSAHPGEFDLPAVIAGLDQHYVTVGAQAKTRCIDGRHDPMLDETALGPQVPGGAPGAALAYRLGVDQDDLTRGTFTDDASEMIDRYLRLDLTPGGHRDDSVGEDGTDGVGCGAIDNLRSVLACMLDPQLIEDHKRLVRVLLGDHFNRDHYLRVLGAGLVLSSRTKDYFHGRGEIIKLLEEKAPSSVTTLTGTHNEGLVIVNLVPGTTLSSNRFAAEHGAVQAFGYDLWRSRQLAELLFPKVLRPLDQERFIHARVMLTIATLMALTDGSLPLLIRLPS